MSGSKHGCESLAVPHTLMRPRLYPCGWRCARHTPAAEKGQREATPGPGWPIHREPAPDTTEQEISRDH